MIIVWVIGAPVLAFYILFKNRNRLDDPQFQRYMIVIYQGFKKNKYYWELLNVVRKVTIVAINVFLSQLGLFYKGMAGVITLIIFTRAQLYLRPFKNPLNNE